jgi:hypothetical protein
VGGAFDVQPSDPVPVTGVPARESVIAQVMTSTSVGSHPTAFTATGLPILRIALNVSSMAPVLVPLLAPLANGGPPPGVRYARLVAYKAGNRGTIQYDVDVAGERLQLFGKLFPQPDQVARVNAILSALWAGVFRDDPDLDVPRPLGTVPDLKMLVYVPVSGDPFDEVVLTSRRAEAVRGTAAWLAKLHGGTLDLDRRLQTAAEVVNLQAWAALVATLAPDEATRVRRLAARLEATAGALAGAEMTPIHKDFHYKHVLVDRGVRVIDFDEVRRGDPLYDVAHFCMHLRLLACRSGVDSGRIATAEGGFLDAYQKQSGRELADRFAWYGAYTCVKIAKQLCTVRGVRPRPDGAERLRQIAVMLDQGVALGDTLG